MAYIKLDKSQLVDLEYSLTKELLRSNRLGTYSCTTLNFCNTRKYHGLLVVPQPNFDNERHVLLSSMDETVIQHDAEFNLGVHKYPGGTYSPKGHKYIVDFETDTIPMHVYRVGGVQLKKEAIFTSEEDRILIKYTLCKANSPTILRVRPYLAFRNFHSLSKANMWADTKFTSIEQGVSFCLYEGYSVLYFQVSKKADYVHKPEWFKNIEYSKELERGYEGHEDLLVPGYFEFPINKNEQIIISVGTTPHNPTRLKHLFTIETKKRIPRNTFENCLLNSASQFFAYKKVQKYVIAGFPWYDCRLRDTFISLPGLTLVNHDFKSFLQVIEPLTEQMKGPHFSLNHRDSVMVDYSADTSLWFVRTLQLATEMTAESVASIWKSWGHVIKTILYGYRNNESPLVFMRQDGLIETRPDARALSWMNAMSNGVPITPRYGMTVETNSLWYNAVMFAFEAAEVVKDKEFCNDWKELHSLIPSSFKKTFWNKEKGYLADNAGDYHTDWTIRPNMIFAAALPYSPVNEKIRQLIVEKVKEKLLTSRGLRSLTPEDPNYNGFYSGNEEQRAKAYHQGTVWPWLSGAYADAYLKIYGKSGLYHIEQLYNSFKETILEHAIGSISEIYEGDPPHKGAGAISMAWSVAEVLRMKFIIEKYREVAK